MEMQLDIGACRAISDKKGLALQFVIKEYHIFNILPKITLDRKRLAFKGGTALNKVYLGERQRFSEDLDFDLDASTMDEVREEYHSLIEVLKEYESDGVRRMKNTLRFNCIYDTGIGVKDHVRIDIALKKISTTKPLVEKLASSTATRQSAMVKTYSLEDLTARKMNALQSRCEGKDVYDVHSALQLCGSMKKPVEKMLESEGKKMAFEGFIGKSIDILKKTDVQRMKISTNQYIPEMNRPANWQQLKKDLIFRLENLA